ncbi:META domain-containing protein [Leptotrichia sp. OH3620_COT-345]|uniref:META domain-containing protein n=1 Tax=Leptotrichia sp. OH3620_COT-345 TaxID=2491048 RepID=UPI000F64F166|nr:META domain-containing protein [Leptotrichia sp. OH3620_COT-345]RRD39396.1 META domain-containing protein [Leptotrichia sp. OH3620_COT-345]
MKIKLSTLFIFVLFFAVSTYSFSDNQALENTLETGDTAQPKSSENQTSVKAKTESSSIKKSKTPSTFKKKDISNTMWKLTELGEKKLSTSEDTDSKKMIITLYLSSNGSINGVAGENGYFGNYRLNGNRISLNLIGSSFSDEVSEMETEYLNILERSSTVELNGNILILRSDKDTLTFEKVK